MHEDRDFGEERREDESLSASVSQALHCELGGGYSTGV